MAVFRHFTDERIHSIWAATVSLELFNSQETLLDGIAPEIRASLPDASTAAERLLATLKRLNRIAPLSDGSTPFEVWLRNANTLAAKQQESDVFLLAIEDVRTGRGRPLPELVRQRRQSARRSSEEAVVEQDHPLRDEVERLYREKEELEALGEETGHLRAEILHLQRRIRAGPQLRIGDHLVEGRYKLLRQVGRGGFGTVWRALDRVVSRPVAVKVLHSHFGQDHSVRARFFRGARYMATLRHPHVVRVELEHGVEEYADHCFFYFFVMEFLSGGDLTTAVVGRSVDAERALRIVVQAGSALEHAHRRGMIHRDVSPENILLDERGSARLADFDLARRHESTMLTQGGVGKLLFSAPEAQFDAASIDARADVFSLGMTAIFALHGRLLPYEALSERRAFLESIDYPGRTKEVLLRAVELDIKKRYPTVALFCEELVGALEKERVAPVSVRWADVARSLELQLVDSTRRDERLPLYVRLASIHEEWLAGAADAYEITLKAFKEYPDDEDMARDTERLADVVPGGWDRFIVACAEVAESHVDMQLRIRALARMARTLEEKQVDLKRAEEVYRHIRTLDPSNLGALDALERIAESEGRWAEMCELLEARARTTAEPAEQLGIYHRLGQMYEGVEQYIEDAIRIYRHVFDHVAPTDAIAIEALERLYASRKEWGHLRTVLERVSTSVTTNEERRWTRNKLVKVIDAACAVHEARQEWSALDESLGRLVELASSDATRVSLLYRRAKLRAEQLGRDEAAAEAYEQLLQINESEIDALSALAQLWRRRNDKAQLVRALRRTLDKGDAALPASDQVRLLRELATIYGAAVVQPEYAIDMWRRLLAVAPRDFEAMAALENLLRAEERWEEVIEVKMGRAAAYEDAAEKIREYLEVAALWENQVGEKDRATTAYEEILEIDATHDKAFFSLEELHSAAGRAEPLIELYLNRLETREDDKDKSVLLRKIAKVYEEQLDDKHQAYDALFAAFETDFRDNETCRYLEKMAAATTRWTELINNVNAMLQAEKDPATGIGLSLRLAKWYAEDLGHPEHAQPYYQLILQYDPNNVAVLRLMANFARKVGTWQKQGEYLTSALAVAVSDVDRKEILTELGQIIEKEMKDVDQGVVYYKRALDVDPLHLPALEAMERIYTDRGQNAELVDILIRKGKSLTDPEKVVATKLRAGGLYETTLGQPDKAAQIYREVLETDIANLPAMRALADVSFKLCDWAGALASYQKVLMALSPEQIAERATIYYRLGSIKQAQGQAEQAINNFEKALGLDPAHGSTLEAMVQVYDSLKDYEKVCRYKRQILDNVLDDQQRIKMLVEVSDIWIEKENNFPKGREALEEALELEPESYMLLHKLLQIYLRNQQWAQMVGPLQRIADIEPQPERKSKYLFTMAELCWEKLDDPLRAVDLFNESLDLNPGYLDAFERINKILTALKEWKQLERAYRKMLHRVAGKGNIDLEFNLWHALGLIYRDRLEDRTAATESFRIIVRLKPEDVDERLILADLYETGEQFDEAIAEYHAILKTDPTKVDPYRKLYRLYLEKKAYDPAWCLAAALSFLRKADDEERKFFEDYRPRGMLQVKGRLDNEQWFRKLFHEEENLFIGKIFEMIAGAALRAKIESLKAKKELPVLDPRFKQDPATSTVTFARTFGWAARVLGLPPPALYIRSDVAGVLSFAPNDPPASVAGQTVLTGFTPQELTFIIGKHLAMYRSEHYIKTLFPTVTELTVLLFAGMRMVKPDTPCPPDLEQEVMAMAQYLRWFIQPVPLEGLRMVVKKFIAEGAKASIERWVQCVEVTAARTGFLLVGDLEIAKKIIAAEQQLPWEPTPAEKLKEILVFSVSEQYFHLRAALGIAIGES